MSFNPFFDVSDLNMEQLLDKQQEVFAKLSKAKLAGANGAIIERLHDMSNTISFRMQELISEQRYKEEKAKEDDSNDDSGTINIG